jgi:hypothetical protein
VVTRERFDSKWRVPLMLTSRLDWKRTLTVASTLSDAYITYMPTCIYIHYIHTYINTYVTYIHTCLHAYTFIHTYIYTYVTYIHTCLHKYSYICTLNTYIHEYTHALHTHIRYIHTCLHALFYEISNRCSYMQSILFHC